MVCEYSCTGKRLQSSDDRINFEVVFRSIETFAQNHNNSVAAISPIRWGTLHRRGTCSPFSYTAPQGVVYLNLRLIREKNLQYRPELYFMKDIVFAAECVKNELSVFRWNRIILQDLLWQNTGAQAPVFTKKIQNLKRNKKRKTI